MGIFLGVLFCYILAAFAAGFIIGLPDNDDTIFNRCFMGGLCIVLPIFYLIGLFKRRDKK